MNCTTVVAISAAAGGRSIRNMTMFAPREISSKKNHSQASKNDMI